jgi:hypothetical protein
MGSMDFSTSYSFLNFSIENTLSRLADTNLAGRGSQQEEIYHRSL